MTSPNSSVDLVEIVRSQARLETKVDLVLTRLDKSDAAHESMRVRVEVLEKDQARNRGAMAAIASAAGIATSFIVPALRSKLGL